MSFFNTRYKTFSGAERAANTNYVNNTGDTIMVVIMINDSRAYGAATIFVDNVRLAHVADIGGGGKYMARPIWALVPPGATYRFAPTNNGWWSWQETTPR